MADDTRYLRIIGRLHRDNRLVLRPGYLTDRPRHGGSGRGGGLFAELVDGAGKLLLRHALTVQPYCVEGLLLPESGVRGWVPFHPATQTIRFVRDDIVLTELAVGREDPQVEITWTPPHRAIGKQMIAWQGRHPEGRPLQYFLRYTHTGGRRWQRVGWRTTEPRAEIDFDQLPGGDACQIAVVATDGVRTTIRESRTFATPVKPCRAMILAPADGAEFSEGEFLTLRGQGYYLEESAPETEQLIWTTDNRAELGRGPTLYGVALPAGQHRITLTAGTEGRAGIETVTIVIRHAPAAR